MPSHTHERVRNIVASPLSGRVGGTTDIRGLVTELDEAIQSEPALAELPGRFMFGVDDGRADTSGLGADVGAHFLDQTFLDQASLDQTEAALLLAGRDTGVRLRRPDTVPALVTVAKRFAAIRGKGWRVAELADVAPLLEHFTADAAPGATWPAVVRPPVGWLPQDDGRVSLGAAVPLGVLLARVAEYLAAIGAPLVITPWRSVLICDLDDGVAEAALRVLAPMGLVFDESSPWLSVERLRTGSPGCEHSAADVRADAAAAADGPRHRPARATPALACGCERACGSPAGRCGAGRHRMADTGPRSKRNRPTFRVSGCSTTSATRPRSIGSRSRRSAPRPDLSRFPDDVARVVVRLIHTCGQVDVAEHVAYTDDVVARARAGARRGRRCGAVRFHEMVAAWRHQSAPARRQ